MPKPTKPSDSALTDDEDDCRIPPNLDYRWCHSGSSHLSLLSTPLTQSKAVTYAAFSLLENDNLEAAFNALKPSEREAALRKMGEWKDEKKDETAANGDSGDKATKDDKDKKDGGLKPKEGEVLVGDMSDIDRNAGRKPSLTPSLDAERYPDPDSVPMEPIPDDTPEEEDYDKVKGVPVAQDGLFEVDLRSMSLFPVFWAHTGSRVPVIRATWFLEDETKPCSFELAEELERGYQEIKPWLPSYPQELQKAIEQGASAEEKLKHPLPAKFNVGTSVVYQNKEVGQFIQSGMTSYLNKLFWNAVRSKPGGITVYRGYAAAIRGSGHEKKLPASAPGSRRGSTSSRRGSTSSNISAGNEDKKDKDKDATTEIKEKPKAKSGLRKSLDFATAGIGIKKPRSDNGEGNKEGLAVPTIPSPQPKAKRQVSQIMEESLRKQGETYPKKKPQVRDALDEETIPMTADGDDTEECTDLILVIHGIGQQLATTYEGFNFVYATNMLRQVMKHQSANPALASIIRDRRVQILPIQWRASLQLAERGDEDVQHGLDNRFTMSDITLPKIPAIRQITNSVLLDVPLFMSQHRQSMIEAVCTQANKAYRMWCARNPGFDSKGRVHVIGHSLGSALAAHILSNQPTQMPPIADLPKVVKDDAKTQFIFNTSNLFLCGSPLGIFLHIDQAQIIPRKGRERTMHSPPDEALDRAGRFGCMAVDNLYNICHYSDPVAYTLTATVDAEIARDRPPLPITSVTSPFYATVTDPIRDLGKYFDGIPFITSSSGSGAPNKGSKDAGGAPGTEMQKKPIMVRLPSGIEMLGPAGQERLQGSRGERRLNALNPHGNIDFMLPSAGMSEYLDALTSHGAYWSDPSFGAFMLAEIFSTKLDLLRTGMGLARERGIGVEGNEEGV